MSAHAIFIAILALLFSEAPLFPQANSSYTGPAIPEEETFQGLFVIERSTNANVVHYEARVSHTGHLAPREPVIAYWRMNASDGRREALNSLEQKRVYGVKIEAVENGESFLITIAGQPGREIRVYMDHDTARAETQIAGKRAFLAKIFISTGKVNIFHVNYVELYGVDAFTGEPLREKLGL